MGIPQIILLAWFLMGLLLIAHSHGKPKTGKNNIWTGLTAVAIEIAILYWGGFFR